MRILLVLCVLLCMAAAPCAAQAYAFGGRGEDVLYEAVSVADGLFAVGKTASSDGDLAARTRTGETGWALRVSADGRRLWDFCSAKSGMAVMTAPHAYADGTFSLVLTDETGQRGEWIVLNARGRQQVRCAIPRALCPEGRPGEIIAMTASGGETGPYLLLLLDHGGGELCALALFADGGVRSCGTFYGDAQGVLCTSGEGCVYVGAELGALALTALAPGARPGMTTVAIPGEDVGLSRVTDALCSGDGSVAVCAQSVTADQKSGVVFLRVSAEGELLFCRAQESREALTSLTETDAGFAACDGEAVLFFDEDGALLGEAAAPQGTLALARWDGGVMALSHLPERGGKQAAFDWLAQPDAQPLPQEEEMTLPQKEETPEPQASGGEGGAAVSIGRLLFESAGAAGAAVTCIDAQGNTLWHTRTPIHTAADRLIWEQAEETAQGEILLTGRYETDTAQGVKREGAMARLSADGVLCEIALIP